MTHALSIVFVTCQSVMQCQITICGFIFCYQSNLVLDFDAGMIWWKYVGPEGKVAKALSHHWPSEHHPPLFLFPPCPHSSNQLFLFLTPLTSDRQRWDVHHYGLAKLLYFGQYFRMLRISWFLLWDPCHVCECPATRNVAGSRHTNVSCGPFPEMSKIATWQSWPSQKWYMSTWDRWFYLSCSFWSLEYFKQNCSCRDFKNSSYHLRDVLGVDAVDGVAHVLLGGDNQAEGKHAGGGDAVVQPEDPAVDVAVGDVQEAPQLPEYLQHLGARLSSSLP